MRKFIFLLILVLFTCFHLCYADSHLQTSSENQIRLGSFNIEKLGFKKEFQVENAAEILKNYDIVAIQEVMNLGASKDNPIGTKGIEALKQIVSYLGEDWDYVTSEEPKGPSRAEKSKAFSTFEYYAFIFRKSKIELIEDSAYLWNEQENPMVGLESQERQFDREPFIASFKAKKGNLDFTLITIHVASPAAKWRRDEIKRLAIVYKAVQDSDPNQNDVFLLGDFNTNVDKKEWDDLKVLEGMRHIITSKDATTLDKARGRLSKNQYDTIWYQGQYSDEDVIPGSARVHQAWQEDLKVPEDINIPKKIKGEEAKQIWLYGRHASDHLPVTMLLWSDRDSDNFLN